MAGPRAPVVGRFGKPPAAPAAKIRIPEYPQAGAVGFWLFLFFIVEMYLQFGYRFPILGKIRFEFILGIVVLALALGETSRIEWAPAPKLRILVAGLFLCMLVQVPLSVAPELSWNIFVDRAFKFALFGFFIAAFVQSPNALRWFQGAFLLACGRMSFEGLVGTVTGDLIWENQGIPRLHGATPSYEHPNSFAGMALGTLPFLMYLAPISPPAIRWLFLGQAVLSLNIVMRTGSRTGYVAFFLLLLMAALRAKHRAKTITVGLLLVIVAIPFIPEDYRERATSIFTGQDKEGHSTEMREEILRDSWAIFKAHPFGVGVGAFPVIRKQTFGRTQDTHNLYFEVGTNLGIQGLVVFLLLIGTLLGTLNRLRSGFAGLARGLEDALGPPDKRDRASPPVRHLRDLRFLEAVCSAVFMFIIVRLGLGLFGMDLFEVYWWFALGQTFALLNILPVATRRTQAFTAAMKPAVA